MGRCSCYVPRLFPFKIAWVQSQREKKNGGKILGRKKKRSQENRNTNRGRHAARAPDDRASPSSVAAPVPLEPVRPTSPSRLARSHQVSGRPAPGAPVQIWPLAAGQRGLPLAGCGLLPAACPARQRRLASWPGRQAPRPQAAKPFYPCPVAPTVSRTVSILS